MLDEVICRNAKLDDVGSIYKLVQQLAQDVNSLDQITIGIEQYKEDFTEGIFDCLVAEHNNKIIGITLYYTTFSTWKGKMIYLEDFVILPEYRNLGIGQKLWDLWIDTAKKSNAKLVKWQIIDFNTEAVRFYKRAGATIEDNWLTGKIIF